MLSALLLLLALCLSAGALSHSSKVFLADGEQYLFFPHRHFQTISTFTSVCKAVPREAVQHHPSMTTQASLDFNNTSLGITILAEDGVSTLFHYAKINTNGVCSVYEVEGRQIRILYEFGFGQQFTEVLMLDKYHTFLWNCRGFVLVEFSFYSGSVGLLRGNFSKEEGRQCEKLRSNGLVCWGSSQIDFITFEELSFLTVSYDWPGEAMRVMLPLNKEQGIFFTCSQRICNITRLLDSVQILDNLPSPFEILGADFNPQTSRIVVIHAEAALIYSYSARNNNVQVVEEVDYLSYVQCVFVENVRFLSEQILVNCNNFMGEAQHLVLIRDRELNAYFPYQPLENSDPQNPCLFDGNQRFIFAVCKKQIVTKLNNLEFFEFTAQAIGQVVVVECMDVADDAIKIPESFELTVLRAERGQAYVDEAIEVNRTFNYDDVLVIRPRSKFAASAIESYSIGSEDCGFIRAVEFSNVEAAYYISLFNREKCVQILAADASNFYRVLDMNQSVYYIELCNQLKIGYGCELVEIVEGVLGLRAFVYEYLLYKLFLLGDDLCLQAEGYRQVIFAGAVAYEMKGEVIRVRSKNKYYYSKSIANIINNYGKWIEEIDQRLYRYSAGSIFEISEDGGIVQHSHSHRRELNRHIGMRVGASKRGMSFPYLVSQGYYLFLINDSHITKFYEQEVSIVIYELPYNSLQYEIEEIRSVENYIVIQYRLGFFEIYDTQRSSLAALIAVQQEQVLCDIVLMDKSVILVPVRSQAYVLLIQTDPSITLDLRSPIYSRFRERCSFTIAPRMSNGSCPNDAQGVSQSFTVLIQYNIQKIDLHNQIAKQSLPSRCSPCEFAINESAFQGPIFSYEFNDDDFGTFQLIAHLNIQECGKTVEDHLVNVNEIHLSDQSTRSEMLVMNSTHVLLLDQALNETFSEQLQGETYCVSYTLVAGSYLVLCSNSFLLLSQGHPAAHLPHNMSIVHNQSLSYQIKCEHIREQLYYIYILDMMEMHILVLNLEQPAIEYVSSQKLAVKVLDFAILNNNIVTLEDKQICVSPNTISRNDCYKLKDVVPPQYASDYDYLDFITYLNTGSSVRLLLISRTNGNLHIDMQIDFGQTPIAFTILNAYAGCVGLTLKTIVSINIQEGSYSNFILLYEDAKSSGYSVVAYYQFNRNYDRNRDIGQVRSAIFLDIYFAGTSRYNFLSFPHRLYITQPTQLTLAKRPKKCISVRVEDTLKAVANFQEPPLLKFLILKVKNINELQPYFIKLSFQSDDQLLRNSAVGFAGWVLFFVLLGVATRRCRDGESEFTIHFISEEIEKEFSEDEHGRSDLLHSQSSPRSFDDLPSNASDQ